MADAYLQIGKKGEVNGECKDAEFANWIEVLSWSWGARQLGTASHGVGLGEMCIRDRVVMSRQALSSSRGFVHGGEHAPASSSLIFLIWKRSASPRNCAAKGR